MEKVLIIEGNRSGYGIDQVKNYTMTVGELIEKLSQFDNDVKIVIGNDMTRYGFYTYGEINTIYNVDVNEDGDFEKEDLEEIW